MNFENFEVMKPIQDRDRYSDPIGEEAFRKISALLYEPLLSILSQDRASIRNSKGDLLRALVSGRVRYKDSRFTGTFSAGISKYLRQLGAHWDRKTRSFTLGAHSVPMEVRDAIEAGQAKTDRMEKEIIFKVNELFDHIPMVELLVRDKVYGAITDMEKQLQDNAKNKIVIETEMTPALKERLATEYVKNTELGLNDWTREAVVRLRTKVIQETLQGTRADTLAKKILAERDITRNRARFIARQEMSLTVSKFRQERYEAEGLDSYRWGTSHDRRVRADHKDLQGRMFFFAEPPIVDKATGRRANPGEDFNCRCVAIPILRRKSKPLPQKYYAKEAA